MRPRIYGVPARKLMLFHKEDETLSDTIDRLLDSPPTPMELMETIGYWDPWTITEATKRTDQIRPRLDPDVGDRLADRASGGVDVSDVIADLFDPGTWDGWDIEGYHAYHSDSYMRAVEYFAKWYNAQDDRRGPPTAVDVQDWIIQKEEGWADSTQKIHFYAMRSYAQYEGVNDEEWESDEDDGPTREERIEQLQALSEDLGGKTPTAREAHESDYEAVKVNGLQEDFGSYNNAIRAADLEVNDEKAGPFTEEDLLEDMKAYIREIGRKPTTMEVTEDGPHSTSTYHNHFGSVTKVIEKAWDDVKDEIEIAQ